jgi:TIR domain
MSESEMPRAPRVFLSYATEDVNWVHKFKKWLVGPLGDVVLVDFKDGSNLEFGPLGPWLDERVDEAAVMVAFVSSNYTQKVWTQAEWHSGLTKTQRGQLIFVPVMMDADAKVWWAQLRKKGELALLAADYQYADFAVEGRPAGLGEDSAVVDRISKMALQIRSMLEKPLPAQAPSPPPAPDIILLGHPFGRFDVDLEAQVDQTDQLLRKRSVLSKRGQDGWRNPTAKHVLPPLSNKSPIFVHPLAPGEIEEPVAYASKTAERLTAMGVKEPRVALWLPNGQNDSVFAAAANSASANTFPALRTDTPQGLATWLHDLVRPMMPDAMVLQIETIGYAEDSVPDATTTQLADDLQQRFSGIVNREILPNPGLWPFWGEEINEQVQMLPGNRVIIAVHDLDITPSADPGTIRASLEMKLSSAQEAVERANKESAGGRKVDPFFTALLVKNAKALPFGSYPSNGRFKDWRLLRFEATGVKPVPASLAVFRGQLNKWAASRAPVGIAA